MAKVIVTIVDEEDAHVYEGDYDAALSPGNSLLITESIPDVAGGTTHNVDRIRTIYNPDRWEQVMVS